MECEPQFCELVGLPYVQFDRTIPQMDRAKLPTPPRQGSSNSTRVVWALIAGLLAEPLAAATIHLYPTQSFEQAVEALAAGDTLVVHAGDYVDAGRISISVKGTATQPAAIRAAPGEARPHIRRAGTAAVQNTINVEGATYLTISGLEISSNGGDGINLNGNPAHVTLEGLDIHDVDVGINFRSSMNNIIVRGSQIYRTGAGGDGTGEGMYVGCNYAECAVRDSTIENNWIHDTRQSTQGDGIEIKLGSYGNLIRDNVVHDTGYPCILTYGTSGNPVNVIEGNVMWGCGDSGIQTAADARIRNNVIFGGSSNGFNSQSHQGAVPGNLEFVHNTIVGGQPCVRLSGWGGRPGLVFANNAIYCDGGGFAVGDLAGVTVTGNVLSPASSSFPNTGYKAGGATADDLTNAPARDVYPTSTSSLIGSATPSFATHADFNGTPRTEAAEAGAYEWNGANNPGWRVAPGFKAAGAQIPGVTLSADPTAVSLQGSTTLQWTAANAASCTASGGWSGARGLSGSETVGPLAATTTFVLTCTGSGGSASQSVSVAVANGSPAPTVSISASPASIAAGESTSLAWQSTNATGCEASGGWSGIKATSGNETVGPVQASSVYTLSCTGPGGSATASAPVSVAAAPTLTLQANPATVSAGQSATLTWTTTGAASCVASGDWAGNLATSGSRSTGALNATSTFVLACSGPGGSVTRQASVAVEAGGGSPAPGGGASAGGGGMTPLALLSLLALAGRRRRPGRLYCWTTDRSGQLSG